MLAFEDPERSRYGDDAPRPLLTHVWYPARPGTKEALWAIGPFRAGYGAVEAPLRETKEKLPLVVLSHGTGGAAAQLSWVAEALVTGGYLVAAVNHHGNTAAEDVYWPQGFALWWERARDLSVLIDRLLQDARFGPRIDEGRIGALGFSLGGYTVLAVAGARTDIKRWKRFCAKHPDAGGCALPPEAPFHLADLERLAKEDPEFMASIERAREAYADPRVRAVVALAPALGSAFDPKSLAEVRVPVKIIVGDRDQQAEPRYNAERIVREVPYASLDLLPQVSHYTFLAECTLRGSWLVSDLCSEPGGVDRAAVHHQVAADARAFFDRELRGVHLD